MNVADPTRSVVFLLICLIQLFYTAVTANQFGNTIQGTRWIYTYQDEPIYDKNVVIMLNDVETLELKENGHKRFQFNENEVMLLSNSCVGKNECLKNKAIAVMKYKEKMEAVQCMNSALLEIFLSKIYKMLSTNMYNENVEKMIKTLNEKYTVTIARMLSWLYFAKVAAHNLLWRIYLRLLLPEDKRIFLNLITRKKLIEDLLENDLMQHVDLCRSNNYLPSEYIKNSELIKRNNDRYKTLKVSEKLYNTKGEGFFGEIHSFAKQLSYKYVSLSDIFDNGNVLFLELEKIVTKSEETKLLLNSNKHIITSQPYKWIERPYDSVVHLETTTQLIKANLMYLVWKHSFVLQESLPQNVVNDVMKVQLIAKINAFRKLIIELLATAIYKLGMADVILINALINLRIIILNYNFGVEYVKQIKLMNTELKNIIKEDLHGLGVQHQQVEALFSAKNNPSKIGLRTSCNNMHIKQLQKYLSDVHNIINFRFISFFLSGKYKLAETFHIPNLKYY